MKNLKWCIYTYRHRKAFEYCVRKYIQEPVLREEMLSIPRSMASCVDLDQQEAADLYRLLYKVLGVQTEKR